MSYEPGDQWIENYFKPQQPTGEPDNYNPVSDGPPREQAPIGQRAPDLDQGTQFNHTMEGIYQELLGKGSGDVGDGYGYQDALKFYNPKDAGSNYGANSLRGWLQGSPAYRNKNAPPSPGTGVPVPGATSAPPASNPVIQQAQARAFAPQAVAQTRNPQLDELIQQMIGNNKAQADRDAADAAAKNEWRNQMRGNIMEQYNRNAAPVDANDPIIRRASQIHDAASQRAFNGGREAMAARAAAGGTPTGASDAYLQSSAENLAKDQSGYESGLMMDELKQRRQQIMQSLSLGAGVLNADENRMLQDKLGTIEAELKQLGLSTDAFVSGSSLDLTSNAQKNQNTQFYDKMGSDIGMQEALMNSMIMQALQGR